MWGQIGRIEAVTVCVDYDDFLSEAIPYNLPVFDRWVIVTTSRDIRTRELVKKHGLECLITDEGVGVDPRSGQNFFNKGRMVERGLQVLSSDCWHVHIDADIVLPLNTRYLMQMADLQPDTIYGVDRIMIKSYQQWIQLKSSGYLEGKNYLYSNVVRFPPGYEIGARWASPHTGYVPIGFFQMWHSSCEEWAGIRLRPYPCRHNSACRTDVQHGLHWDRCHRQIIPEIIAVHLESESSPTGINWQGRKTKRFGPDTSPTSSKSSDSVSVS